MDTWIWSVCAIELNAGPLAEDVAAQKAFAAADGRWNRTTIAVSDPSRVADVTALFAADARVRLDAIARADKIDLTACLSRTSCGTPARSGTVIGRDADGAG